MDEERPAASFREVALAIEFMCWSIVLIAPLLRLVNGPAVSDDQFAIQVALFTLALTAAIALRVYNYRR